jgi:uncharacterized membrane protein YccC
MAYAAWPTWEREQLPESMAALLDAYRSYFQTLTQSGVVPAESSAELESLRQAARLARSNMEASVERYRAEPHASADELERVMSMLASSHRFAHAVMTIEAELVANPSRSIPREFSAFFTAVDLTLELLVAALRRSRAVQGPFPDLRELHTQLLQSSGSAFPLLATETDRIANSLNTLREQITAWVAPSPAPGAFLPHHSTP